MADAHDMTRTETRDRLVAMMREISRIDASEAGPVDDATPCVGGTLLADSLDVLEFIVALEREFDVSIRDAEEGRDTLESLGRLTDYVMAARG